MIENLLKLDDTWKLGDELSFECEKCLNSSIISNEEREFILRIKDLLITKQPIYYKCFLSSPNKKNEKIETFLMHISSPKFILFNIKNLRIGRIGLDSIGYLDIFKGINYLEVSKIEIREQERGYKLGKRLLEETEKLFEDLSVWGRIVSSHDSLKNKNDPTEKQLCEIYDKWGYKVIQKGDIYYMTKKKKTSLPGGLERE